MWELGKNKKQLMSNKEVSAKSWSQPKSILKIVSEKNSKFFKEMFAIEHGFQKLATPSSSLI